ncbi:MAG: type I 3-dehydroquinate dehydratase [Bacteroidales bacterium]|nr:type I 3-dehydroquinate dehydratase [Bacteroidales bacterium]
MICVAISDKNFEHCLSMLEKTDMAEIRLDLTQFSPEQVRHIFSLQKKLIATYRPLEGKEEEQKEQLKAAIEAGADYMDIEFECCEEYRKEMIEFAHKHNCDVIISYHNFDCTPGLEDLRKIVAESFQKGADLAKIATMVKTNNDNAEILSLYNIPGRVVAFGMGNLGKITRIVAPFLGAEFTYAAMDEGEQTAPGQIKYSIMKAAIQHIENL